MKSILYYLPIALIFSISSCAQNVSHDKIAQATKSLAADKVPADLSKYSQATFAAGCFWHEETLYESINGVIDGVSGYAGGTMKNPTYEDVETGNTGHADTVNIYYDSSKISYTTLLQIYFESQEDPTQVN